MHQLSPETCKHEVGGLWGCPYISGKGLDRALGGLSPQRLLSQKVGWSRSLLRLQICFQPSSRPILESNLGRLTGRAGLALTGTGQLSWQPEP